MTLVLKSASLVLGRMRDSPSNTQGSAECLNWARSDLSCAILTKCWNETVLPYTYYLTDLNY
jgi:hypothetical protein